MHRVDEDADLLTAASGSCTGPLSTRTAARPVRPGRGAHGASNRSAGGAGSHRPVRLLQQRAPGQRLGDGRPGPGTGPPRRAAPGLPILAAGTTVQERHAVLCRGQQPGRRSVPARAAGRHGLPPRRARRDHHPGDRDPAVPGGHRRGPGRRDRRPDRPDPGPRGPDWVSTPAGWVRPQTVAELVGRSCRGGGLRPNRRPAGSPPTCPVPARPRSRTGGSSTRCPADRGCHADRVRDLRVGAAHRGRGRRVACRARARPGTGRDA